ncbi:pyruvate carboxylase subunit B [Shewanella woodyi]|uniref:Conserved carboxylase region n=1 Tax=Shewanella woodyi (strain ATCC 51908 / MS32) TaxID=392500 RepID=B1KNE8_SHEWM|nr:pyruvate carboxylase subunit B [Shewanella woodyi]ACA86025.1 Conserved carboxylase region [Shewanella woodyi ATCC 51908]
MSKRLALTDVVLRDINQLPLTTHFSLEELLPIAEKLDQIGFWSLETWSEATFDSCIRYLGEDPWHRIRELKKAMPNTRQQMSLSGQKLLGYRHYADDVVIKFVEHAHRCGIDIFTLVDEMNDVRNLKVAVESVVKIGGHAQGTICYTSSPAHNLQLWLDMAKGLEEMGCHSIVIKDVGALLNPFDAYELVLGLKKTVNLPISIDCQATEGLSTAVYQKVIEAGVDIINASSFSMGNDRGCAATETVVAMTQGTEYETSLELELLDEVVNYLGEVSQKYKQCEGSSCVTDVRILMSKLPEYMLTDIDNQLKEHSARHMMSEVLQEIPKVRQDLGSLPLVGSSWQIVATQAVLNVLTGERYKTITKETVGVLKGEYGSTAGTKNAELLALVLDGNDEIICRPADLIDNEFEVVKSELEQIARDKHFSLSDPIEEDVLTYALFPQIGLKFLECRNNPVAAKLAVANDTVTTTTPASQAMAVSENYSVRVNGVTYQVEVSSGGAISNIDPVVDSTPTMVPPTTAPVASAAGTPLAAPLAGNIFKVLVKPGQHVATNDVVIIIEAMKMEVEVCALNSGVVSQVQIKEGDSVTVGDILMAIG